mmetsp:Transcript_71185/g.153499  ORF Transcript_71185/g.153499 Transcript_71185/m.153499 type:complete len:398 (+) Transcript_71185:130-1323(+)
MATAGEPLSPKGTALPPIGGLAARRALQGKMISGLEVNTEKMDPRRSVIGQLHRSQANGKDMRSIEKTDSFSREYALGKEVMPSVHPGMEIRFATRLADKFEVVIKVRRKSNSFGNSQEEKEWRQSAEFMLNLPRSGQIAQIYCVLEDKDAYYVVMEKVGGSDLFEMLDAEGLLPIEEAKAVVRQLLKGVAALHEEGCIHKDLKLENVMVHRNKINAEEPVVKLIDFDTVEHYDPATPKPSRHVTGTDQYISPEAYAGVYSPASDIFAVGVIGYRLLTGRFPFSERVFEDEGGCDTRVGSPHMRGIRRRLREHEINYKHKAFVEDPQACNLIRWMLSMSESRRPTADLALVHPWLSGPIRGDVRATGRSATERFGAPRPRAPRAGPLVSPRQAMVWV